jgi:copper chaperone CopZ
VRDALKPLPGVVAVDVKPGERDFTVAFDPARVNVGQMLAALQAAREPAAVRE